MSHAHGGFFRPLLEKIQQPTVLWGRDGTLSLEVGAFGEVSASFVTEEIRPGDLSPSPTFDGADAGMVLADGRVVELKQCAVPQRRAEFFGPQTWQLRPLQLTVRAPTVAQQQVEYGVANFWLMMDAPVEFGGIRFEFRPDLPNHRGYSEFRTGEPSPITYWAIPDVPSGTSPEHAWSVLRCLLDTASMLRHERIATPCCRVVDGNGKVAEFVHRVHAAWPKFTRLHLLYTRHERTAIEAVGRADVLSEFSRLELSRYVDYVIEARRSDLFVEQCAASALMALESLSGRWLELHGTSKERPKRADLPEKLKRMNTSLRFIDSRFTGEWLRKLRNEIMHEGKSQGSSLKELDDATNDMLVLATDLFFRLFGFVRREQAEQGGPIA